MVPATYVQLERMPLTPNGKLDRKALPEPEREAYAQLSYEPPQGEMEEILATLWQELLGVERLGRHDHFFELGGHSLLAMRLQARIWKVFGVELPVGTLFACPTLMQLAQALTEASITRKQDSIPSITPVSREGALPLSFAQQRLWFLAQLEPESAAYNIPIALRLCGDLDGSALRRSLDALFVRHESLRSIFVVVDGQPHVELLPAETGLSLLEEDLRGVKGAWERVKQLSREEAWGAFDLARGPLIRACLIQLEEQEYVFLLTQHHIVSDQWSMGIFVREIGELYRAFSQGRPDPLAPLSIQYPDYAAWQRQWLSGERTQKQSDYWRETLADAPTLLDLPTDRLRPPQQSFAGSGMPIHIDRELTRGLKELSSRYDATLFMTLLSAWAAVLSRLSGQEDLVIGVPTANRGRPETEGLIGFFVNTLALRVELRNEPSVAELLGRVRATALAAQDNQDLPFEQVVEIVQPPRRLNHTPLFQVMFLWQNNEKAFPKLPRVAVEPAGISYGAVRFDLEMALYEQGDTIVGSLDYATALFDEATIRRHSGYLITMLKAMVADSEQRLADIELLASEERMLLLEKWNATEAEYPEDTCIHELFEEQVRRTPEATALVYEEQSLSYEELNQQANQLAHYLIGLGVKPDNRVAICVERSLGMVIGLMGILKAGGAYVPLDPAYPSQRLREILADAEPKLVLSDSVGCEVLGEAVLAEKMVVDMDQTRPAWAGMPATNPDAKVLGLTAQHPAYVIYTSGSTGKPKGVIITHDCVVNFLISMSVAPGITEQDRLLAVTSISFDIAGLELYLPLSQGARIVIASRGDSADPKVLQSLLARHKISVMQATPATWRALLDSGWNGSADLKMLCGGEALAADLSLRLREQGQSLWNMYGPTETTIWSSCLQVQTPDKQFSSEPIGRPIGNTRIYVLDGHDQPVPLGAIGEIYIGGAGVARGYLDRVELTAERFVPEAFSDVLGERMYKTGDLGRYLPDGNIEFLGRNDYQVKIRGYRIELGEIEARLAEHEWVREAVVVVREDGNGEKRLVAYVVPVQGNEENDSPQQSAQLAGILRSHLAGCLPEYMVPAAFVQLKELPLTVNGKLDRRALPAPEGDAYARPSYEAPQTEMEQILAEVWQELLGVERVGRHDNFFELGGHSLLVVHLIQRLRRLQLQVGVRTLFATPVLSDLASVLGQHREVPIPPNVITPETRVITLDMLPLIDLTQEDIDRIVEQAPGGVANIQDIYALTPLQEGILFHYLAETEGDAYVLSTLMAFPERAQVDLFLTALQQAVLRHDILRTCIHWQGLTKPAQVVLRQAEISVTEVELDPANGPIPEQLSWRFDRRHRIDLTQAPLLHFAVSHDPETHCWVVLQRSHHLIADHSTLDVLRAEVSTLASGQAQRLGRPEPFRNLVAQARLGTSQEEHERYFRQMLEEVTEPTLPFGLANVLRNGEEITETRRRLPQELNDRLRVHARRLGVSLASLCHLAWGQVLARTSGLERVVFGTVLSGRMQGGDGADQAVGLFINTLPMRLDLDDMGTENAVRRAHARLAELLMHEHASLALAQRCSGVKAPAPLFSVLLNYRHNQAPAAAIEADAERVNPLSGIKFLGNEERTNYPVTFSVEDDGQSLGFTALVERSLSGERVCGYMQQALESLVQALETAPSTPVRQLEILPPEERTLLLESWNATEAYQEDVCIQQLFEQQVEKTPAARAVEYEGETLSYKELNERANRLAHYLIGLGVKPDDRVAICVERSLEMVIGLLGVLKAGGAYVPLEPNYPMERLCYMLEDSSPSVLLTQANRRGLFPAIQERLLVLDLDDGSAWRECPRTNPDAKRLGLVPHHLAYLIYTSGSTGMPKGVMVEHAQVSRLLGITESSYGFNDQDVWCLFHSLAFDFSVWELWGALAYGGRLVIVPRDVARSSSDFYRLVCAQGVTVLNQTPSAFKGFIQAEAEEKLQHRLRYVIFGGEALEPSILKPWYSRHTDRNPQLVNMYGITETTVHVTYRPLQVSDSIQRGSPIGKRLADLRMYLLDQQGGPVPLGAVGEIYVGGAGVARGYWNRPDLTKERFLKDPFCSAPGARMYKTGDLARYLPDGNIEFLGRNDQQVKIRGFRIELGEIEAGLREHPLVREAVVVAQQDGGGEKRLVAYVIPTKTATEQEETTADLATTLRAHLTARLPEYMVPAAYVRMEELPLTPNGKLDRRALPEPEGEAYAQRTYEPPQTELEQTLANIWQELLGVERVGRHDHFFQLGGHSLLAIRLIEQLRRANLQIEIRILFTRPVLSELAAALVQHREVPFPPCAIHPDSTSITPEMLPLINLTQQDIDRIIEQVLGGIANIQDIYSLTPLQDGILFHHMLSKEGDPYILCTHGIFADRELLDRFLSAMQQVTDRHDILRTSFLWKGLSQPAQVVWRKARLSVTEVELDEQKGGYSEQLAQLFDPHRHRIDLGQAPLLRFIIAREPGASRWLALRIGHHLIEDALSVQMLRAEVSAILEGRAHTLAVPQPFRNFLAQAQSGVSQEEQERFFRQMLGDVTEPTLPFGLSNVHNDGVPSTELRRMLPQALNERLRVQARRLGVSMAGLGHLAWGQVLARCSGVEQVVFGTVLTGRMQGGEGVSNAVGFFINTLPLRLDLDDTGTETTVRRVHASLAELVTYENTSLGLALRCSGVAAPTPLFSSTLNYRNYLTRPASESRADTVLAGIKFRKGHQHGNYPVAISFDDLGHSLITYLEVVRSLSGERVYGYFQQCLESLAGALENDPHMPVRHLEVLPPEERHLLLETWNTTEMRHPAHLCIHELFEAQVKKTPEATAVVYEDQSLSYAELNAHANRLAHYLLSLGVKLDQRVAICMERSLGMVVGMLAILKAGGAYVPLDPAYPSGRLQQILSDAASQIVLSDGAGRRALGERALQDVTVLELDELGKTGVQPPQWVGQSEGDPDAHALGLRSHDLAYVIYTSGSTGTPKGVMVEHRGVVNFLCSMAVAPGITVQDRLLAVTSISFDIAGLELYLPLSHGSQIVVASRKDSVDPQELQQLMKEHGITMMQATPATWRALLDARWKPPTGLKILCGGEALPADLAVRLAEQGESLWNLYGPTETTIWSACVEIERGAGDATVHASIGRPIGNTQIYLLDEQGQPVPQGAVGEIYIGGAGVARGYLNRPELTAERFVLNPFSVAADARMYRTGDLARHLADGNIEFLGRNDQQVKIRGYRIELGEIEARLAEYPGVREAVVIAREDVPGDKRLVGYLVPQPLDEFTHANSSAIGTTFSLFYFGADSGAAENKYELYLKSAKFADENYFEAAWTPERHFHNVGQLYPNPATLSAALSTITTNLKLRAGSVVLPLHDPIRVAEEWAIVDNLSNGRVGIAAASGWHPRDFSLIPQNYSRRRQAMQESIQALQTLWRGETITRLDGNGKET
ncbi:MAG TPA: amino acid adenylation domain-containing protein, partial [Candidatus Angelobacter sp.]